MQNENGSQADSDDDVVLEHGLALEEEDALSGEREASDDRETSSEREMSDDADVSDDREISGESEAEAGHETALQFDTHEQHAADTAPSLVEKFVIRLPAGLRDQIKQLSEQNRRSMNAEIILVLENHIRQQLLEQMAQTHDTECAAEEGQESDKEQVLKSVLEKLPAQKQQALLELLRN
ncbi:MAG TPA: Arc family DNA-binding protein [Hyphomicrobiales bacterium]|nr:Arc family DNA-binding protein [Hyphomicrobiales bacterium]